MQHTGAAPATGLASAITASQTSFNILSGTGYPTGSVGPFVIVLDQGTASEEKVLCTSLSGTTITVASSGRGWDNTTASAHNAGTTNVEHVFAAAEADDDNSHIYTTSRDDHTQYAPVDGARATVTRADLDVAQNAATGSAALVNLNQISFDTPSAFNTSTHLYTCPYTGFYRVSGGVGFAANGPGVAYVFRNGTIAAIGSGTAQSAYGAGPYSSVVNDIIQCNAGDTLALYNLSETATTLEVDAGLTYLTFELVH